MKKLCKDREHKMICGVCAGIAEYFGIDPTVVRVIWALVTVLLALFGGIIIYAICALVMPDKTNVE
ncbi:MAG: PspC domain-containing protein [Oscillospiraceae bacterium]|nr:PspC domain-containing protein [Ruminococcus sp.]MCD8344741.1 PspC domain-containing protein [Oscillospiraceae bacterium]